MKLELEIWWFVVNVFAVAAGPWIANSIVFLIVRRLDPTEQWDPWRAYREDQMGFVAMGWATTALYEIASRETLLSHVGFIQVVLGFCIAFGALFAAGGARQPVDPATCETADRDAGIWNRLKVWADFYQFFTFSLIACLVSFVLLYIIHVNNASHLAE